jgi:hypothetical protein
MEYRIQNNCQPKLVNAPDSMGKKPSSWIRYTHHADQRPAAFCHKNDSSGLHLNPSN